MDEFAVPPVLGILGYPIAGNPMQFAIENVMSTAEMDWRFLSFEVEPSRIGDAICGIDALGFRGVSIALPFGREVLEHVEKKSELCTRTQWCDTIARDSEQQLVAHHTLADALLELVQAESLTNAVVGVLGNSPKTMALTRALMTFPIQSLWLRDASMEPLESQVAVTTEPPEEPIQVLLRGPLCDESSAESFSEVPATFDESHLDWLASDCVVIDFAVTASTSPLLRIAEQQGMRAISSIDLFVQRAAIAFRLWTGKEADQSRLREAFEEYLEI